MGETFKAECPEDQLVMMTQAFFGMMERNRCIQPTDDTGMTTAYIVSPTVIDIHVACIVLLYCSIHVHICNGINSV